jgi:hypothetical protein
LESMSLTRSMTTSRAAQTGAVGDAERRFMLETATWRSLDQPGDLIRAPLHRRRRSLHIRRRSPDSLHQNQENRQHVSELERWPLRLLVRVKRAPQSPGLILSGTR